MTRATIRTIERDAYGREVRVVEVEADVIMPSPVTVSSAREVRETARSLAARWQMPDLVGALDALATEMEVPCFVGESVVGRMVPAMRTVLVAASRYEGLESFQAELHRRFTVIAEEAADHHEIRPSDVQSLKRPIENETRVRAVEATATGSGSGMPVVHVNVEPPPVPNVNVNVQPADVRVEHHDRGPSRSTRTTEYEEKMGDRWPTRTTEEHEY